MKHKYYLLLPLLLIGFLAQAQQFEVKGTVTSISDGFPLPGVLVEVKNNKISTLSDAEGKYKIQVSDPEHEVLVFTFMGFLIEEIAVKKLAVIDVALSEDIERDAESESPIERARAQARAKRQKERTTQ